MKLPAYSDTAPKTNMMQERSQIPMEVIPATTKKFSQKSSFFLKKEEKALFLLSKFDNAMEH